MEHIQGICKAMTLVGVCKHYKLIDKEKIDNQRSLGKNNQVHDDKEAGMESYYVRI